MKPRSMRNPNYGKRVPFPAASSQCQAIYEDGYRCMAHRRLRGGESVFCSEHAKLPVLEPDYAFQLHISEPFEIPIDLEDWAADNGFNVW